MSDPRVQAIREDKMVGRNTCSTVDEAFSEASIIEELDDAGIKTPEAAVKWAIEIEDFQMEKALNQRSGEDSDTQLKMSEEWDALKKEG
jgi:hypothetical protein